MVALPVSVLTMPMLSAKANRGVINITTIEIDFKLNFFMVALHNILRNI
jgi:hypothetical protein